MQYALPLLRRFFAKVVLNVLPAAMASVIGGILFTHYQLGGAIAPQTGAEQLAPASAEMMKLVRDEHALIVDFLKAQLAAEKSRLAEEEKPVGCVDGASAQVRRPWRDPRAPRRTRCPSRGCGRAMAHRFYPHALFERTYDPASDHRRHVRDGDNLGTLRGLSRRGQGGSRASDQ